MVDAQDCGLPAGPVRQYSDSLLGAEIGERNLFRYPHLEAAANMIEKELETVGYAVHKQTFEVEGKACHNLEAQISRTGQQKEIVVIGAHYDSAVGCPGSNDNATGVAAMLALARAFTGARPQRTLRFVGFVNEEPPYFQTSSMGSVVYASRCRAQGDRVAGMLSLETIGYYSQERGSQHYPFPFGLWYPSTGDFIGFVGNISSRKLVRQVVASFRHHARFPSEGAAVPGAIPGVGWSDHRAFWRQNYPGVMVTDTALFRDPCYHTADDTPGRLDYDRMARVVSGLERVVAGLVGLNGSPGPKAKT